MLNAKITGIASFIPDDVLDNEMLSQMVDTNDEWITTRVGVKERRILKKDVGSSYMGIQAVNKLLEETGRFPSTASVIAHGVGIEKKCYAYDIQAACAGFLVGLYEATAYIRAGIYKKVIVVSAEKMSSMVDYNDRATCPLFGDAAACMLLEPTEEPIGVMDGIFHVDGSGLEHLVYKAGGSALRTSHDTVDANYHCVYQEGRAVYRHAVIDMLTSSRDIMERNNLTESDIQWFVPHQANLRIIEAVGERLKFPEEKIMVNIQHRGNTSAASIPLCLDENKHLLKKGDKLVLTAFGAGFTWGALYLIWSL